MLRVNVYVVTYNNPERINQNVERFFKTTEHLDTTKYQLNYHIINNHSNFILDRDKDITVFHNSMRPDFSCGHLARDYNMSLVHGFKNLLSPSCDQVVLAHDDSLWNDEWFENLQKIHETYTFYSGNHGCSMTSILPEAVRKIGLWDERFCNIGYHEADYFLRALIYNKEKSSINDAGAGRILNPTMEIFTWAPANHNKFVHGTETAVYHPLTSAMFTEKWGGVSPCDWNSRRPEDFPVTPAIKTYVYYPYFEKDIEDLANKKIFFGSETPR
jgi:hypothetical protein